MKNRNLLYVGIILLTGLILGFINLPADTQKKIFPWTPQFITDTKVNLGLDLQGGSQLDYKIDLRKVPEKEQKSIIDGILNVITKRVNGLGVSEPNIYTSDVGDEKHLVVELAGIKDLNQAKQVVGKTIQLEFKEQRTGAADPKDAEKIKAQAQSALDKIVKGGDIKLVGPEEAQSNPTKIVYSEGTEFKYKDELPTNVADVFNLQPGQVVNKLIEEQNLSTANSSNQLVQQTAYEIVQLAEKRDQEREVKTPRQVQVSHILISYKGAEKADASVTRTQDEAQKLANDIADRLKKGEKFEDLAKQYSNDAGNKDKGGVLDKAAGATDANYVKEFSDASLALKTQNELSPVVKTVFGYHIIKANSITEEKTEKKVEPQVKLNALVYDASPDQWQATGLNGEQFVHADVEFNQAYNPYVSIQFNDEGAKLFEDISGRNVGKPLAIFVGGKEISAPTVNQKISGGKAQITGRYTIQEANDLARDLNTGAIPAPISLVGQYTIGASLGQDALNKSLFAGVIGFLLVAAFMVFFYRIPGFLATIALAVYSAILIFAIKIALPLVWALAISILIFSVLISKILKNKDSTAEKTISLLLSCFILFFISFLLSTSVVMTLAGIAGVILSIGMAVDANILIFERIKEELRDGRGLGAAIEIGFDRAWNSIRDSNFSSLITCGILFYFGSSMIQGFAFNLAAGILVSMFTAITVTKTLLHGLLSTKLVNNIHLFGKPKEKSDKKYLIVQNRKIVYIISSIIIIGSLLGLPFFGLKMGLDFTGGSLMEFKTDASVTSDSLRAALTKSADATNQTLASVPAQTQQSTQEVALTSEEKLDFSKANIVSADNGFIVKTTHISSTTHDTLISELKKNLPSAEETRFSSVGPTVGTSMEYKALLALLVASIMIIIYIAFAFRKVPRYAGKWRFGTTAVIALLHDLIVMLGVYIYLGHFMGVEIDALFITAMLTILGFSVHDTIVVFDRIREKLKFQRKDQTFEEIANDAVNETLSRSIHTSLSVLLTLLAVFFLGAESIRFFILSLIVGVVTGTYSSICVATPLLVDWNNWVKKQKK